uniref:Protein regulator of cytokinesis 1 n=2 Tax=Lygus hesperus TaxID=30085 RepID=A0A0A9XMF1_LYGHE
METDPMEKLVDDVAALTRDFIPVITDECKAMYRFEYNLQKKYADRVLTLVKDLYDDVLKELVGKKSQMVKEIEACLKEHSQLQQDLHLTIEKHFRDDDPLQIILHTLNDDMKAYREMKAERLKTLADLRKKETELCDLLGVEPLVITSALPSETNLHELDQHIFVLRKTKIDRSDKLNMSRERLNDMMRRLESVPSTEFEKEVCEGNLSVFKLTEQNMNKLEDVVVKYETLVGEATERVDLLESKLEKLWDRIRLPDDERRAFNETYYGIGRSAVSALTHEIERCEILKRANMKSVIEMVRKEIANLWDRMTFTTEARMDFNAYFTDTYNEDVLELHEMEQSRLEQYYEKYKDLFTMADKRDHLLTKMEEFAASAKDPNRYKNRGGQLLREEKERKSTEAQLAKIESQLKRALPEFHVENNGPFLWRGEDLFATLTAEKVPAPKTYSSRQLNVQLGTKRMTPSSSNDSGINMRQLSSDSILSSYSRFQEHIDAGSSPAKRARTPAKRTPSRIPAPRTPGSKTPRRFI